MSNEVEYIVIHCSATRPSQDIGAAVIDGWHKAKGWLGIGYHFVIRRGGMQETGRALNDNHILEPNEVGAHVQGFNSRSIGICLVGGVTEDDVNVAENNFTMAQWAVLRELVLKMMGQFPHATVVGHSTLNPGKACPSFNVEEWLDEVGIVNRTAGAQALVDDGPRPLIDLTADPNDELDRHDMAQALTRNQRRRRNASDA